PARDAATAPRYPYSARATGAWTVGVAVPGAPPQPAAVSTARINVVTASSPCAATTTTGKLPSRGDGERTAGGLRRPGRAGRPAVHGDPPREHRETKQRHGAQYADRRPGERLAVEDQERHPHRQPGRRQAQVSEDDRRRQPARRDTPAGDIVL